MLRSLRPASSPRPLLSHTRNSVAENIFGPGSHCSLHSDLSRRTHLRLSGRSLKSLHMVAIVMTSSWQKCMHTDLFQKLCDPRPRLTSAQHAHSVNKSFCSHSVMPYPSFLSLCRGSVTLWIWTIDAARLSLVSACLLPAEVLIAFAIVFCRTFACTFGL